MKDKTKKWIKAAESATDAEKMGFNHRHISNCCNKRYGCKTHKGYKWRYENE